MGTEPGRRRVGRLLVFLSAVVIIGIAGTFGGSMLVNHVTGDAAASRPAPPPPVQPRSSLQPDKPAPAPTPEGLAAALAPLTGSGALGTFSGAVIDPATGQTLWQKEPERALVPASTGKVITASAALLSLDPQHKLRTTVVRGPTPGNVVLVGGGDPTLSSMPKGQESVYPGAAHLDDLVEQVRTATGGNVDSITVDTGRYAGPDLAPGWNRADISGGYIAPVQPVMLDGGRANPTFGDSARSATPALDAGRELARRLGASPNAVSLGAAPPSAPVFGEVHSPNLQRLVETFMVNSDNVLAEAIAREVAIANGSEPSFAGAQTAIRSVLERAGFDLADVNMVDGSGLSSQDRLTARTLSSLLTAAAAEPGVDGRSAARTSRLRPLLSALPVAGGTGSLTDRYRAENAGGRGWVRAKTGTLNGANSLAGVVTDTDGRLLVFALMSNGTSSTVARPGLDAIATRLRDCGCRSAG